MMTAKINQQNIKFKQITEILNKDYGTRLTLEEVRAAYQKLSK
jgi:hypothetical protein